MTWREEIKATGASFRGVPFKTTDFETQLGRRNVVHEAPQRDRPFVEDLGQRAGQWSIDGYVQGDDYLVKRDALMRALNEKGAGELVHPRCGTLQVNVIGVVSVRESHKEGGIAHFRFTVVDSGSNYFPAARQDTVAAVEAAADRLDAAAADRYASALQLNGPAHVLAAAIADAKRTVDGLLNTARQVTSLGQVSALVTGVMTLSGSVAGLIRTPAAFVGQLRGLLSSLVAGVRRPVGAVAELRALVGANARPTATARPTSTRGQLLANQTAHGDLVRTLAISNQARLVAVAIGGGLKPAGTDAAPTFQDEAQVLTATQAIALRDQVLDQIDTELETNEPEPATAMALEQLRTAVERDVAARAELLAERSTFTPQAVLPALVLAHRIYQDASRAGELVERNAIRNPNFVPAAPLEVLA